MKILVALWGADGGGAERVAITLANALAELGEDTMLHLSDGSGPFRRYIGDRVLLTDEHSRSHVRGLYGLRRAIADFRPDVVLSHQTPRNCLAIFAHLTAPGRKSRRVFVVEHGEMLYNSKQKGWGRRAYYWLAKGLYPLADGVIACSQNIAQSAMDYVGPRLAPVKPLNNPVIHPGIAAMAAAPATHPWLVNKELPVFLGVGRLVDQKNFTLLINAFKRVQTDTPSRLIIVGEGNERPALEAQIRCEGLEALVDLAGFTDNPMPYMKHADVLVMPSHWEGLPTVAIEAMYCGMQVVSTDNSSGIHEILDHGRLGLIVPRDDALALATSMRQALASPRPAADLAAYTQRFEALVSARTYLAHLASSQGERP